MKKIKENIWWWIYDNSDWLIPVVAIIIFVIIAIVINVVMVGTVLHMIKEIFGL
jgi:high-affinity Fe2+/Pb2+ permease